MGARFRGSVWGIHLVPIVHCVGLHIIDGAGGDGRCGHNIDLHVVGVMEVMPQCLQLWEICTKHGGVASECYPSGAKLLRHQALPSSAPGDSGFRTRALSFKGANKRHTLVLAALVLKERFFLQDPMHGRKLSYLAVQGHSSVREELCVVGAV